MKYNQKFIIEYLSIAFFSIYIFFNFTNIVFAACMWQPNSCSSDNKTGGNSCEGVGGSNYCCCDITDYSNTTQKQNTQNNNLPQIKMPNLEIKIPYVNFTQVNCQEGQTCAIPWIGEYIVGIYKYIIYVMGIVAVIVLMIGGVRWLTAGGSAGAVEDAKGWIMASLSGLLLTLLSFLILQQINPKLTQFDPIGINVVEKIDIDLIFDGSESTYGVSSVSSPTATGNLTNISCGGNIKCTKNGMALRQETSNALNIAAQLAEKEGIKLTVTSAYRTLEEQQALWDAAVKKHGSEASKYVARPSTNSPHVTGTAVDICIDGYCNKMNSGNANLSDEKIQKLQNIMKQAGFTRYCGEWWHFEYGSGRKNGC